MFALKGAYFCMGKMSRRAPETPAIDGYFQQTEIGRQEASERNTHNNPSPDRQFNGTFDPRVSTASQSAWRHAAIYLRHADTPAINGVNTEKQSQQPRNTSPVSFSTNSHLSLVPTFAWDCCLSDCRFLTCIPVSTSVLDIRARHAQCSSSRETHLHQSQLL